MEERTGERTWNGLGKIERRCLSGKKESNPIVMFFKRRAIRIVGIIGLSFVILYASAFTAIFLDSTLKNPEQIKFVTDPVAMKQYISNNEQIRMFTIFFFVILLLGIITLLVGGKSSFKVDMIEITPEIHTPVPVGQGQHGTANGCRMRNLIRYLIQM